MTIDNKFEISPKEVVDMACGLSDWTNFGRDSTDTFGMYWARNNDLRFFLSMVKLRSRKNVLNSSEFSLQVISGTEEGDNLGLGETIGYFLGQARTILKFRESEELKKVERLYKRVNDSFDRRSSEEIVDLACEVPVSDWERIGMANDSLGRPQTFVGNFYALKDGLVIELSMYNKPGQRMFDSKFFRVEISKGEEYKPASRRQSIFRGKTSSVLKFRESEEVKRLETLYDLVDDFDRTNT
ncbi:MAG: hypothetical protein GOU97_03415 [Nanoarchaeota archaeon]|nr:hypothetical protein [Nanoarchaeota archaeon]